MCAVEEEEELTLCVGLDLSDFSRHFCKWISLATTTCVNSCVTVTQSTPNQATCTFMHQHSLGASHLCGHGLNDVETVHEYITNTSLLCPSLKGD